MPDSPQPHILVIVLDRLGSSWLGPYGNAWIPTPNFNRLAAQSLMCVNMLADSLDLISLYRSYWQGLPSYCETYLPLPPLPQLAQEQGLKTWFFSDNAALVQSPPAQTFQEVCHFAAEVPKKPANSWDTTHIHDLFMAAADTLKECHEPTMFWLHASALDFAWDAPFDMCDHFTGEDDPPPVRLSIPPSLVIDPQTEVDKLTSYQHAYAGQIAVLDEVLGKFLARVEAEFSQDMYCLVTSPRAYALGEHGAIGDMGNALRSECMHTPCFLRFPKHAARLTRLQSLHSPTDIYATLAAILNYASPWGVDLASLVNDANSSRAECMLGKNNATEEWVLRTTAWYYRQQKQCDQWKHELYAKPDDRWEINEIAQRASDELQACQQWLDAWQKALEDPNFRSQPLPEILKSTLR
jgi:Sulfatase